MAREIVVGLSSNGRYWHADWQDAFGKRRRKSLGPKDQISARQARKLCQRLANTLNLHPQSQSEEMPTLANYLREYIESRGDIKPATRYLFDLTGRYLVQFFGERTRLDAITRQAARAWRTALAQGSLSDGRTMAEVSVCHRAADAKTIFKRAVDDDILPFNPFDRLKVRSPRPDKDWHYVSLEELEKLLAACRTAGWKALIALCRLAGLRRGEAVSLPWSCVDFHRRRIIVYASKTGSKRHVPIVPRLHEILLNTWNSKTDGVEHVAEISAHCLWRNFTVIRKRAGLPEWDDAFQVMRRNCETDWAQHFPQYVVSEWMGHDITVSAIHYLRVPEELFAKAAGQLHETTGRPLPQSATKNATKSDSAA
jgi:integrase